ncbi:collagen binding domain-containing protein [Microbacterium sp. NPDC056052]|uniref:MSCRAMM family protein n=1 Tax=Microbacterium sp. NPDC056052 TaxID=3345695 RepID=UPI0035DCE736
MSGRRGWKGALTALLAAALMFAGVGAAHADPTPGTGGSISGVVTSDVDGSPIAGLYVQAQNDDGSSMSSGMTGADGAYRIDGLLAGPHRVHFLTLGTPYISEYWDNSTGYFGATTVDVQDGAVTTGIDAGLAEGATISGVVTREDGSPATHAFIAANGTNGGFGNAVTDSDGAYTLQGLVADSYTVQFSASADGLISEYWDDASDRSTATKVAVASGGAVTGIDAVLSAGGSIQGVVTLASDGSAVANGGVAVLDASGNSVANGWLASDGSYRIDGIRPGDYKIKFASYDPKLLTQYWAGAATAADATPVTIVAGQTVSGIDAALRAISSQISGTVTRAADGLPAAGISVSVQGSSGYYSATTDDTGAYRIPVVPGTYTVSFRDPSAKLATQWWSGAANSKDATPVTVVDGADSTGIDAQLAANVTIKGSVLIDGSTDLRGNSSKIAVVAAVGNEYVGMSYVRPDGTYSITVAPGTYTVKVELTEGLGYAIAPQYYSHASSAADATPVVVSSTGDTTGIDFDLSSLTAKVELSAGTVQPGAAVHVTGSGFMPGESVAIELHSDPISLGTLTAGSDGVVDTTVTIPADAPAGAHRIVLTGQRSTLTGGSALTIAGVTTPGGSDGSGTGGGSTPASGSGTASGSAQLAATGAELPDGMLLLGALMLLIGVAVIRIRRRA